MSGLPPRLTAILRARIDRQEQDAQALRDRAQRRTTALIAAAIADVEHVQARVRALSPQATLDRGYAVVTRGGTVVREPAEAIGRIRVRVARGEFEATPIPSKA